MSPEASSLIHAMLRDLSTMTHAYRSTIEGCYIVFVENKHYDEPTEGKDFVVDEVLRILNELE